MQPSPAEAVATISEGRTNEDTIAVLRAALRQIGAREVLDIGCGNGAILGALAGDGHALTGIDRSAAALDQARRSVPGARFHHLAAEDLNPSVGDFDAAFFVNSLHHVAPDRMQAALLKAASVLRPDGALLVIEPLAQGSFFRAMRPVEDESARRAKAAAAIEALISTGRLVLRDLRRWNRESRFAGLDDLIAYLARVLPERVEVARRNAPLLARAWRDNIRSVNGLAVLVQPMICWTLTPPAGVPR